MAIDTHSLLRRRLLERAGIEPTRVSKPSLAELRKSEWLPEFEQLMRNRLVMGAIRYGLMARTRGGYDNIESIRRRLVLYEQTGNLEHLVDCANLLMLEFKFSTHPQKHFKALDESIGAKRLELNPE